MFQIFLDIYTNNLLLSLFSENGISHTIPENYYENAFAISQIFTEIIIF